MASTAHISSSQPCQEAEGAEHRSTGVHSEQSETQKQLALRVLQIIEKYGIHHEREGQSWDLEKSLPLVIQQMEKHEPIRLLLPGFPFKSPNSKDKVLGVLPDLGEKLALSHLNAICEAVAEVYEHGAEVHICSDGLVYNNLLGVSDETVWDYGEAVRLVAQENGLNRIRFIRLWDLLDHPGPWSKDFYLTHASCIRRELLYRFGDPQFEEELAAKSDEDMRMTHQSYIKAVSIDLAHSAVLRHLEGEERETKVHSIAKQMMGRWRAYASAMEERCGNSYVRLSIHDSKGGAKLSLALIPQGKGVMPPTPWHSAVLIARDGSYRSAAVKDVDQNDYELVCVDGRPSHFREKPAQS